MLPAAGSSSLTLLVQAYTCTGTAEMSLENPPARESCVFRLQILRVRWEHVAC